MRAPLALLALPLTLALAACGAARPPEPEYAPEGDDAVVTDATPQEVAEGTGAGGTVATPAPTPASSSTAPTVRIETSMGPIRARLDAERAPVSVANFLQYVRAGFYDGTIFHRIIDGFMIQGGGFLPGMVRKPTREPIILEVSRALTHVDGAIAMARTNDPNSATAQFYICDGPQPGLDGQYAVFGAVIEGMDVVRAIASTPTDAGAVPSTDVVIRSVRVE